MSTIDPSRLLQMRSSILNQNQALQRAAGRGGIGGACGAYQHKKHPPFGEKSGGAFLCPVPPVNPAGRKRHGPLL